VIGRAAIVVALIACAARSTRVTVATETPVARQPLSELPLQLGPWTGVDSPSFPNDVTRELGVDDHINRSYTMPGAVPVALYAGYYAAQRQGDTIHSPQNCLPGSGWYPIESARHLVHIGDAAVEVNRYVVQKGIDQMVVLYWYEGRGRVVASEYANKGWLFLDAARLGRTSGGLVRVIAPVVSDRVTEALEAASAFARNVLPPLEVHLP
jgi:EpsI family protein